MMLYMPTKVYQEKKCVENHSRELAALGTSALIVTGKHSSRINGSLEDVKNALEREQIPYTVFDEVEENPSVETVKKAASLGLSAGADFVVGIGGGSPMDAAKAVALLIANPERDTDFLYQKVRPGRVCTHRAVSARRFRWRRCLPRRAPAPRLRPMPS